MMWQVCWTIFFSSQFDLLLHSLHSSEFSCQKIQRGQNYHLEKSLFFFYETCLRLFKYTIRISGMNFLSQFWLPCSSAKFVSNYVVHKGQLNSEWIYEVIISPKMPTKNLKDFCPGSLLEGRAEILKIFGWHFGIKDDIINSFWI